jgi:hypothetical protein
VNRSSAPSGDTGDTGDTADTGALLYTAAELSGERGGCSCAGTYGHYLLEVGQQVSHVLTAQISSGDLSGKPGWVRMSIHPTMTDEELRDLCGAVRSLAEHWREWATDYIYDRRTNEFSHHSFDDQAAAKVEEWFEM